MITKRRLKKRLNEYKERNDKLYKAYIQWRVNEEEYKRQKLIYDSKIEELEDLICGA